MRYILLLMLWFGIIDSYAQPTLTAGTSNPLPGDTAYFYRYYNINAGDSGANVTWDFSFLTGSDKDTVIYTDTADCIGSSPMYARYNSWPVECYLYNGLNDSFFYTGSSAVMVYVHYYDPQVILRYPCTYGGNEYVDSFSYEAYAEGNFAYGIGYQFISGDGYGTLILPDSTYTNVLRIKRRSYVRSINYFMGTDQVSTDEIYEWYSETASRTCLLKITDHISTVAIPDMELITSEIQIYPNPANDVLFIDTKRVAVLKHLSLKDISGRTVKDSSSPGSPTHSMDVHGLSAGLYCLDIQTDKGIVRKKVQIQ